MTVNTPLSKSALQAGAQCPRMLWIRYNMPNESDEINDEARQEVFAIGNLVGEAAQHYFENEQGKTVVINTDRGFSPDNYSIYAQETEQYMSDPDVVCIAEATFFTGDLIVFVDLLHRNPNGGWDIIEVKATKNIGPVHVRDAAWQTYVARELCGIDIRNTYLMHPYKGWQHVTTEDGYSIPDNFELVDDFADFIYNYSTGMPSPENAWLSGQTIAESISLLSNIVKWEYPPVCTCEPGYGIECCSPYRCNFVGQCKKMCEDERAHPEMYSEYHLKDYV